MPFAHWNPPAEAPRRYATWFFLGGLPAGSADVVVDGKEIGDHVWTTPSAAIERHAAGEIALLPPTWVSLRRIADLPDVAGALADVRAGTVDHFSTHIADLDGVLVSLWEPDAAYDSGDLDAPRVPATAWHGPRRLALRALRLTARPAPTVAAGRGSPCEHGIVTDDRAVDATDTDDVPSGRDALDPGHRRRRARCPRGRATAAARTAWRRRRGDERRHRGA